MSDRVADIGHARSGAFCRLVVVLDLVESDQSALEAALRVPTVTGAVVTLTHVLPAAASSDRSQDTAAALRRHASSLLTRRPDVRVDIRVRGGDEVAELESVATEVDAELIIVSRWTRSGRTPLGLEITLAEQLARRCDIPVMAASGAGTSSRHVLVAAEAPDHAAAGVSIARRLLEPGGQVQVMAVLSLAIERRMLARGAPRWAVRTARRWLRGTAMTQLRAAIEAARLDGVGHSVLAVPGDPRAAIEAVATRSASGTLVVAVDRAWLRGRLLRPSLVSSLLRRGTRDVVIVRSAVRRSDSSRRPARRSAA